VNYYNIAADFKAETINEYARLNSEYKNSKVLETYGQMTVGNIMEGGRAHVDIPKIDFYDLKQYVEYSLSKGIGFNYSLNGSCMNNKEFTSKGLGELIHFLKKLNSIGIKGITVALPSIIEVISSLQLGFEIKLSIISQVNTVNKAMQYKNMGVARIVTDEAINRDFTKLRSINQAFGSKIEIIVNSMCHKDCVYRPFHYNQTSHDSIICTEESINTYYNHRCMTKKAENPEEWLKLCWVRPEDIPFYNEAGIYYFKLQGRHTVHGGDPVKAVESYFQQSFSGDLIDLFELFNCPYSFGVYLDNKKLDGFIKKFYSDGNSCINNCNQCGYCKSYAKKIFNIVEADWINAMAKEFYTEFDQFSQMLCCRIHEQINPSQPMEFAGFDFEN
jgi:collagenase-like PrtC family protease